MRHAHMNDNIRKSLIKHRPRPQLAEKRMLQCLKPSLMAVAVAGLSLSAQAGKIYTTPSVTGAAGFGGWNLDNVEVIVNGSGSFFDEVTGD